MLYTYGMRCGDDIKKDKDKLYDPICVYGQLKHKYL
jgi:hypothetical protein